METQYESPVLELTLLGDTDVIATSTPGSDWELPGDSFDW